MRDASLLLPEPFPPTCIKFLCAPQQARTPNSARVASIRTSTSPPTWFAECQARAALALFAKPDAVRTTDSTSSSTSTNPRKTELLARDSSALVKRTEAGMCVALRSVAMLLSELAIIYLATAAPFGVSRFLNQNAHGVGGLRALAKSAAASLAWPLTALLFLLKRTKAQADKTDEIVEGNAPEERRVERVKRATVNSLRAVEDALVDVCGPKCEAARQAFFAARECVERYAGLAMACAGVSADAVPSEREMELCRIAGRAGDDLLLAGRCFHRRNVTRLLAHRERARAELVHALAAAREVAHTVCSPPRQFNSAERHSDAAVEEISEALLQALSRAIELLSLFDDRSAVVAVARLLDAECARVRRLEAHATVRTKEGDVQCTTQMVHTAFAMPRRPTTRSQGG
jgi:hypothetical protein